jgi:uracil-DNA glycosylase family 4
MAAMAVASVETSPRNSAVRPGTGWPGDPATPRTPVAAEASAVRTLSSSARTLTALDARVSVCRACPRLVAWREEVARSKRKAFAHEPYWGRPAPGWGADRPRVLIVGLAPAAHGANRTGRVFTGDRSGDWLFAALHRAGLAAQPTSVTAGDGQHLPVTRLVAVVRCAPPANTPTPSERETCAPWLRRELQLVLPTLDVAVVLGGFAWSAAMTTFAAVGCAVPAPRVRFGHGVSTAVVDPDGREITVLGCYHPSQQNTFTGRLTEPMIDEVLGRAASIAGGDRSGPVERAGLAGRVAGG